MVSVRSEKVHNVQFSSVQDGDHNGDHYLIYLCAELEQCQQAVVIIRMFSSVQFGMVSVRSEKVHNVQFSSVQFGMVSLRSEKVHNVQVSSVRDGISAL